MTQQNFWRLFRETGAPIFYILYKASDPSGNIAGVAASGQEPEPGDLSMRTSVGS